MSPEVINGLFLLGGVIIGAGLKWLITWKYEKRKILAAYFSPFSKLVEVSAQVASKVTITIHAEGEPVENLYITELTVLNLGNVAIKDIFLTVHLGSEQHVVTHDIDGPARKEIVRQVILPSNSGTFELDIPFLNPTEQFRMRFYVASKDYCPSASFRQPDVEFRTGIRESSRLTNVLGGIIFAAIERNLLMNALFSVILPEYRSFKREKDLNKN